MVCKIEVGGSEQMLYADRFAVFVNILQDTDNRFVIVLETSQGSKYDNM